jgi:hypothetical protein
VDILDLAKAVLVESGSNLFRSDVVKEITNIDSSALRESVSVGNARAVVPRRLTTTAPIIPAPRVILASVVSRSPVVP